MTMYNTFADNSYAGQVVLITGAASGMGLEAASAFAHKGAEVVLCDLNMEALRKETAKLNALGLKAHAVKMDVSKQEDIDAGFAWCDANLERLDVLVTCAAIGSTTKIPDQDWALWHKVLDINLMGTFFCVQAAIARMAGQAGGGRIVCVASDAGIGGGGGLVVDTPYAASKAATLSMVKSVAREMAGKNVRINALSPGPTDSPFMANISKELKKTIAGNIPMRRMGQASDMAAAMLFLCSNDASFVYGSAMDVNGGSIFR